AAIGGAWLQAGDRDLPLHLVVGVGVACQHVGIEAGHGEAAIARDADGIVPALALEAVDPLRARGVAGADAREEVGRHAIVDASRRAAEIVGEGLAIAVAPDATEATQAAGPHAERARRIAGLDVAGLR